MGRMVCDPALALDELGHAPGRPKAGRVSQRLRPLLQAVLDAPQVGGAQPGLAACAPGRMLAPTFEKLAQKYGNEITFAKVNVDERPELAEKFEVRSIPTLMLLREGNVVERLVGARPYEELAHVLDRHATAAVKK